MYKGFEKRKKISNFIQRIYHGNQGSRKIHCWRKAHSLDKRIPYKIHVYMCTCSEYIKPAMFWAWLTQENPPTNTNDDLFPRWERSMVDGRVENYMHTWCKFSPEFWCGHTTLWFEGRGVAQGWVEGANRSARVMLVDSSNKDIKLHVLMNTGGS